MSYSTLIKLLEDNNLESYGNEKGMGAGIAAAYRRWEEIEKDGGIPTTCNAIANTFVGKEGKPAWINY